MKILLIAPLPPPVNGHSVVSQRLLEHLRTKHVVSVVNIRKRSLRDGVDSPARVLEVLRILISVFRQKRHADVVYLTISESLAGNLKDLVVCLLCRRLHSRMVVHLHGGSLRTVLYERHKTIRWVNKIVFGRLAGAIVSGPSHAQVFDGILDPTRVHFAANFADDQMFSTESEVKDKFSQLRPIRILYISHMTEGKGYNRLAEAFASASGSVRDAITIDFAGAFETERSKRRFLTAIRNEPRLNYHGVVDDATKLRLFRQAHILCLPTSFLEGQPIAILEAYAAGCVVLATGQPGIRDVFTDNDNGFELAGVAPDDILRGLSRVLNGRDELEAIAVHNRRLADERYRVSVSMTRVSDIIEGVVSS
jgi:glycosyltransferase involved in cell wall biosynthesis